MLINRVIKFHDVDRQTTYAGITRPSNSMARVKCDKTIQ